MKISERHEALLKVLHSAFKDSEFAVSDVLKRALWFDGVIPAFENIFGKNFFRLKRNLIEIKIGRLFQQKIHGVRLGAYELCLKRGPSGPNRYSITGPPMPREPAPFKPKVLTVTTTYGGLIRKRTVRDRDGEPLRDKSADPPIVDRPAPVQQPGSPPKWRQPTRAELAARHHQHEEKQTYRLEPMIGTGFPDNGAGKPAEATTLWNGTIGGL